jgi:hypothetical protein
MRLGAILLAAFAQSGCGDVVNCPLVLIPNITIIVHDSLTGDPAARGASGFVIVDNSEAALELFNDSTFFYIKPDHSGIFGVRLQKPGYLDWLASGVVVERSKCGVVPVTLRARVRPT